MASPGAWRLYSGRKADPRFKSYELKVFQRDRYTCQFCGFQARLFQDIVNLDGDYSNNQLANLVTSCCFCAQCCFLESVGVGGYGGGTLVYLPELSQSEVNSLCHVLFCAITNDTGYKNKLDECFKFMIDIFPTPFPSPTRPVPVPDGNPYARSLRPVRERLPVSASGGQTRCNLKRSRRRKNQFKPKNKTRTKQNNKTRTKPKNKTRKNK